MSVDDDDVVDMHKANGRKVLCCKADTRHLNSVGLVTSERVATFLTTPNATVRVHMVMRMAETKLVAEKCMLQIKLKKQLRGFKNK